MRLPKQVRRQPTSVASFAEETPKEQTEQGKESGGSDGDACNYGWTNPIGGTTVCMYTSATRGATAAVRVGIPRARMRYNLRIIDIKRCPSLEVGYDQLMSACS